MRNVSSKNTNGDELSPFGATCKVEGDQQVITKQSKAIINLSNEGINTTNY